MSSAAFAFIARGGVHGPRFLFPLLLLVLLGLLVGWLIWRRRGVGRGHARQGSAMQTLQERFARGEIDRNEFEHRKAVLVGADVVPSVNESGDVSAEPKPQAAGVVPPHVDTP